MISWKQNVPKGTHKTLQDGANLIRAAFLAFIIDSQHSLIFGHLMVLTAQELNLTPPCKEDEWAATTATEWQRVHQRNYPSGGKQLSFIDILKMFTNDPKSARERISLDPFGSFIALHGLISVKWHLNQKAIGMGS
jgi:Fungal specific transcription factor domain